MDLERKNIEPENIKDPIIFMSVFNDMEWKKNDENCIWNAERESRTTQRGFYQGIGLFWVQVRKRDGTVAHMMDNGTRTAKQNGYKQFKETGHPIFTATSALSRGMLKQKKGKRYHTLQWRFHERRTIISNI